MTNEQLLAPKTDRCRKTARLYHKARSGPPALSGFRKFLPCQQLATRQRVSLTRVQVCRRFSGSDSASEEGGRGSERRKETLESWIAWNSQEGRLRAGLSGLSRQFTFAETKLFRGRPGASNGCQVSTPPADWPLNERDGGRRRRQQADKRIRKWRAENEERRNGEEREPGSGISDAELATKEEQLPLRLRSTAPRTPWSPWREDEILKISKFPQKKCWK